MSGEPRSSRRARALPHESARDHVRGSATYTDDQRPFGGMLHLWPVVGSHAHARITGIDVGAALELDGVVRVLTHADVPGQNDCGPVVHDEVLLPEADAAPEE